MYPPNIPIQNEALLKMALRHRSATENPISDSYERLEFFGDSVLGMVIAQYLYEHFPEWDQGVLSKAKATIVQEQPLADAALRLGLDAYIEVSPQEAIAGAKTRASILADVFEAIIGGLYLEQGLNIARWFVLEHLHPNLTQVSRGEVAAGDFKSKLQEIAQARWKSTPTYQVRSERGESHEKSFEVIVVLDSEMMGVGFGRNKKEAEQMAAKEAIDLIERVESYRSVKPGIDD